MSETDNYARHEILHMSLFLAESVHEQLASRPLVQQNPEWKHLAERAHEALFELYQAVGGEHLDDPP